MNKKLLFCILVLVIVNNCYATQWMQNLIFNSGDFISIGDDEHSMPVVEISNDGKTWQKGFIESANPSIFFNGGLACNDQICIASLASNKGILYSSDNGNHWYLKNIGNYSNLYQVIYENNTFIILGNSNILYSYDGLNWKSAYIPSINGRFVSLAYGNNLYVATLALGDLPPYMTVALSQDGQNWYFPNISQTPLKNAGPNTKVRFADNNFYFYYTNIYNGLLYTPNIVNFFSIGGTFNIDALEYQDGIFFGNISDKPGFGDYNSLSFNNGESWVKVYNQTNPSMDFKNHYAYGHNIFVYVNGVSLPQYSYNGINWVESKW